MINSIADLSPRKTARIAGFGYLVIIITGIFAEFFVRSKMVVPGDAAATANHIVASEELFRTSIASDLIMLLSDVIVAWALYVLLKPVNKSLALLATFFRLVHAAIYGINLLNLFFVLQFLSGNQYLSVFETGQLQALVLVFLNAHQYGYDIGLVFFGFHCLVLGYLVFRSGFLPSILGILLVIAAIGYLINSFARFLITNYEVYETIFTLVVFIPAFIAELSFTLWLLLKGVKKQPVE
jgi:hypothetical protein